MTAESIEDQFYQALCHPELAQGTLDRLQSLIHASPAPLYYRLRARLYDSMGQYASAAADYRQWHKLEPNAHAELQIVRTQILVEQENLGGQQDVDEAATPAVWQDQYFSIFEGPEAAALDQHLRSQLLALLHNSNASPQLALAIVETAGQVFLFPEREADVIAAALLAFPDDPALHDYHARFLTRISRPHVFLSPNFARPTDDEVMAALKLALQHSNNPQLHHDQGILLLAQGALQAAQQAFTTAAAGFGDLSATLPPHPVVTPQLLSNLEENTRQYLLRMFFDETESRESLEQKREHALRLSTLCGADERELALMVDRATQTLEYYTESLAVLGGHIVRAETPELYRLRIRLHERLSNYADARKDYERLLILAPDPETELQKLRVQSFGSICLGSEQAITEESWGADITERADAEISAEFQRLLRENIQDAPFLVKLVEACREHCRNLWRTYTVILQALAAHPQNLGLLEQQARFMAELAWKMPDDDDTDQIPSGYFPNLTGTLYHALTVQHTMHLIDAMPAHAVHPDLWLELADLYLALEDYAQAAVVYARAANTYDQLLQTVPDESTPCPSITGNAYLDTLVRDGRERMLSGVTTLRRDSLVAKRDKAILAATACREGPEAICRQDAGQYDGLLNALGPNMADDLRELFPDSREECTNDELSPAELSELAEVAEKVAVSSISIVCWKVNILTARVKQIGEASPWLKQIGQRLPRLGYLQAIVFDNSANAHLGQVQSCAWFHAEGIAVFVAETVSKLRLRRLLSEMSDGRVIITADARGSSYFSNGPEIMSFTTFNDASDDDLVALHEARVGYYQAEHPGVVALHIDGLQGLQTVENYIRELNNQFRLTEGLTDIEIRGMHVKHHTIFAPMLQAEFGKLLAHSAQNR